MLVVFQILAWSVILQKLGDRNMSHCTVMPHEGFTKTIFGVRCWRKWVDF